MSFLLTFDMAKLEQILDVLPTYEKKVKDAEPLFQLEGRKLEEAMRVLPHYQSSYDRAYQEMKALEEWLNVAKEKETGRLWKKYIEGYPKQLSTRDVQAYIGSEKTIVELNQIIIEATLLKNQLYSIVEAFKQMGWMLGNVTKLRVAELNDAIF